MKNNNLFFKIIISITIICIFNIKKIISINNNNIICVNLLKYNSKLSNITNENYVSSFQEGPCSPIIIIPGYMGSKLEFKLTDPILFKENHPEIIEKCEWKNLNSKSLKSFLIWINIDSAKIQEKLSGNFFKKQNNQPLEEEYIPHFINNITFDDLDINLNYKHKPECYGSIMRLYFKSVLINEKNNLDIINLQGAEIKPYLSNNRKTCGKESISNFLDSYSSFARYTLGFKAMISNLEKMGYKLGLSLFANPYDWRLPLFKNTYTVNKSLKTAYEITKKKSILIGHSLGGLLAYETLLENLENYKDNYYKKYNLIERIIPIGSPFLGSLITAHLQLEKNSRFIIKKQINLLGMKGNINAGINEKCLNLFDSTNINKYIIKHQSLTLDKIDKNIENTISKIYPNKEQQSYCKSTIEYLDKKTACSIPDSKYHTSNVFKFNSKEIKSIDEDSYLEFINLHKYYSSKDILNYKLDLNLKLKDINKFDDLLFEYILSNRRFSNQHKLVNIPFTFIYANNIPTESKININNYDNKKLIKVEKDAPGDGTVNSFSAIYPGLRWLSERALNQEDIHEYPIHFVEYCSTSKDHNISNDSNINKTQYMSLQCECISKKNINSIDHCNHSTMISDKHLIEFIELIVYKSNSNIHKIEGYDDLYKSNYNDNLICSNLYN